MKESETNNNPEVRGYTSVNKAGDVAQIKQTATQQGWWSAIKLVAGKIPSRLYWRIYYAYHLPIDRRFDKAYGVDTSSVNFLADLTIDSPNKASGLEYEPTSVKAFPAMLKGLPDDLSEFVFVDFGCGKGRTLLLASSFNFKKIIGVEFAKELAQTATNNIAIYKNSKQQCSDIKPVHCDAAVFDIPEDACVFYFYYPFREDVMAKVLDNIVASYKRNPRRMYFINRLDKASWVEVCERLFGQIDFLRLKERKRSLLMNPMLEPIDVVTYETI